MSFREGIAINKLAEKKMAEFSDKDIEFLFQEEVLDQHGEFLMDLFEDSITRKNVRESDELLESIDYKVSKRGKNRVLTIMFEQYGRFIEIRMHKRKKNKFSVNTNQLLWGSKDNSMKKKSKNVDWYSKNAYGSLNRLISMLMNDLSEKEIARLKGILENRQTSQL